MDAIQGNMIPIFHGHEGIDNDETPYKHCINSVTIRYENLKSEYRKVHRRVPKNLMRARLSWMRVENGDVSIIIDVNSTENSGLFVAKVGVQRERKAYEEACRMNIGQNKYLGGEVNLNYNCTQEGTTTWRLNLDLDSVYDAEENGIVKEVYALCPSNIYVTNKFQLVTELYVRQGDAYGNDDRFICRMESQPFLLRTELRSPRYPSPRGNDPTDDDESLYEFRNNGVTIHYENLKSEYTKVHRKIPKRFRQGKFSWMGVKNGVVSIGIDVNAAAYSGSFVAKVVVQRDRKAYEETLRMNDGQSKYLGGEVNLNYNCTQEGTTKWKLNLDLDSVYDAEENGIVKEVYALCPSNIYVTNKFQLVTELYVREDTCGYGDRLICKKRSQPFLLRTPQRSPPYPSLQDQTPPVSISPVPIPEAPDGIFNILSANTASIDTLEAHVIKTRRRDIGYHIPLKDYSQKGELDEGDVVGFFEDEYEKTAIERLSKENYDRAKLAGVITRSYYVAGLCSDSQMDNSDLVCVIGIVKVRVLGPVRNGDQLYAYKKRPGVAATRTRLLLEKREENDKTFLIGQAIESKNGVQYDEETLVSAFVSVVNGIDCLAMNQRVESLDKNLKGMIQSLVYDATKKIKRRFFWLKALLLVAMLAVGIALWQRYAPNTLLRESMCKRGSYKENKMPLRYNTSWEVAIL